eukprot:symbB.v1.2.037220.t1/scaffold5435.1/size40275/3
MYATIGYIVPEYYKFPGFLSPSLGLKFADVPNGLAAFSKLPVLGGAQIIAFAGLIETTGFFQATSTTDGRGPREGGFSMKDSTEADEPGNYGVGFPNFLGKDGLTGSAWGDWSLYTASPLRAFEGELGVQAPVGFWDPAGLSSDGSIENFKRRRAVEIKHGRIAMYATIGYIANPELDDLNVASHPNGQYAVKIRLPVLGGAQIIAFAGLIETTGFFQATSTTDGRGPREGGFSMKDSTEADEPGNYGVGFPNFLGKVEDPEARKSKLAAELANGRLAMMAIIGMFFQDGLTGSAWGDWSLYTASPLRAEDAEDADEPPKPPPFDPATQVGAMAPLGFFDPAGFSKVGDKEGFQNLRAAEIKHGRVAMMAALGAVAQHYIKFPGFESVPAGMGAVTTAPGTYGFAALFLLSGAMELAVWTQDPNKEAGDFGDPAGLGQYNEEFRNKELNNGRFAMFAALGIISADLFTGKDAIQQFG